MQNDAIYSLPWLNNDQNWFQSLKIFHKIYENQLKSLSSPGKKNIQTSRESSGLEKSL